MNKFKSTIEAYNKMIKTLNDEYRCKIHDYENPEFFISKIEYNDTDDKVYFKCEEDV